MQVLRSARAPSRCISTNTTVLLPTLSVLYIPITPDPAREDGMTITASKRLTDPDGRAWLRAALKTVNAPLPVETAPEDMVDYVLDAHPDLHVAVRIAALIDEVPGPTLANLVARGVVNYNELKAAMERIRTLGLDVTETENGRWITEMAGFEMV